MEFRRGTEAYYETRDRDRLYRNLAHREKELGVALTPIADVGKQTQTA